MGKVEFIGLPRLPLRLRGAVEGGGHRDGARRRHAPCGLAASACQGSIGGAAKAHRSVPAPDAAKGSAALQCMHVVCANTQQQHQLDCYLNRLLVP
eukprot:8003383-Alexandrium_andersonii.AAC.1